MKRSLVVALITITFALPALAMTYKTSYPVACNELWTAVKDTLSDAENYNVEKSDDAQMNAAYQVKHSAHVNISGALLQRTNHVKLVTKGTGCEMQVGSNYGGWEHNDQGDFKKRVEESLAKLSAAKPAEPANPQDATK